MIRTSTSVRKRCFPPAIGFIATVGRVVHNPRFLPSHRTLRPAAGMPSARTVQRSSRPAWTGAPALTGRRRAGIVFLGCRIQAGIAALLARISDQCAGLRLDGLDQRPAGLHPDGFAEPGLIVLDPVLRTGEPGDPHVQRMARHMDERPPGKIARTSRRCSVARGLVDHALA